MPPLWDKYLSFSKWIDASLSMQPLQINITLRALVPDLGKDQFLQESVTGLDFEKY